MCDLVILLLGIDLEKTIIQKDTCNTILIAALLTTARTWKEARRPSTGEWIKRLWYIYTAILVITNNEMLPFAATWLGLEIIMLSEVSHRKKNII